MQAGGFLQKRHLLPVASSSCSDRARPARLRRTSSAAPCPWWIRGTPRPCSLSLPSPISLAHRNPRPTASIDFNYLMCIFGLLSHFWKQIHILCSLSTFITLFVRVLWYCLWKCYSERAMKLLICMMLSKIFYSWGIGRHANTIYLYCSSKMAEELELVSYIIDEKQKKKEKKDCKVEVTILHNIIFLLFISTIFRC